MLNDADLSQYQLGLHQDDLTSEDGRKRVMWKENVIDGVIVRETFMRVDIGQVQSLKFKVDY